MKEKPSGKICTEALKKSFGTRTVLELPRLEFDLGRIYAVIGANGSGKSTFVRILSGMTEADDGKLQIERSERTADKLKIGYMPQKSYAFRMSVRQNLLLNEGCEEARADELLEAVKLTELSGVQAKKLSGGETARMALARILMRDYELLLLDEPTAAMDIETTILAEKLLRDYCERTGCCMILITHSLQQARRMADELLFLHKGKLIERGSTTELLSTPKNPQTQKFIEFYGN